MLAFSVFRNCSEFVTSSFPSTSVEDKRFVSGINLYIASLPTLWRNAKCATDVARNIISAKKPLTTDEMTQQNEVKLQLELFRIAF